MVDSMATMALETLRDLLIEEAKFLSSVSGQVEEVRQELNTMHSFLKDADRRADQYDSNTVRNWVEQLRDLAIQAENVLDRYAIEVASKSEGKNLKKVLKRFTCILCECVSMHVIGREAEDIRSRMARLTQNLESINKSGESSSNSRSDTNGLRRTYGLDEVQQHFVGMKEDIEKLESLLTSQDNNGVISICGMGGLGKSTLAAKLYNKESVRCCFDAHAWICVSQQFQREVIFEKLLKQLDRGQREEEDEEELRKLNKEERLDEDELVRKLIEVQREKNCLVVLDDVWENEHWRSLRHAFPIQEGRGKILLTTRKDDVASIGKVHRLKLLSEDEGWELLQKIALPNYWPITESEFEHLENNGKEIVRKCGFLPLAISVVGGILREKKTSSEWETVKEKLETYLKQGEGVDENKSILQVLDLSYNSLPYHLKPCFLFLGCFPEDVNIDAEKLFHCWMAEGIVSSEDMERGETLRDVAKRYLSEMVNRNMVIQEEVDALYGDNMPISCRLHDLMRDLCLKKGKKEKLLEVVDNKTQTGTEHIVSLIGRTRWMALLKEHLKDLQLLDDGRRNHSNMRSLLILGGAIRFSYAATQTVTISSIDFGMLRSLRILILKGCMFQNGKLPRGIEKLMLLKHFSIEDSEVDELPRSLHKLQSLQSLNLNSSSDSIELNHRVINNLKRLRHLVLPEFASHRIGGGRKLKMDRLSQLQTLLNFDSGLVDFADLLKLPNLQHLEGYIQSPDISMIVDHILGHQYQIREIHFVIFGEFLINSEEGCNSIVFRNMLMCHSLTSLKTHFYRLRKLPVYEPQLGQNLVQLELWGTGTEEDPMETLEKLPKLRQLELRSNSFLGEKMVCGAGGFPQLRKLSLRLLTDLVEWRVEEEAMPNLSSLKIKWCLRLKMLPEGLRFINTLKSLSIFDMPQEFKKRMQLVDGEGGEDFDKIKHIPSVLIN